MRRLARIRITHEALAAAFEITKEQVVRVYQTEEEFNGGRFVAVVEGPDLEVLAEGATIPFLPALESGPDNAAVVDRIGFLNVMGYGVTFRPHAGPGIKCLIRKEGHDIHNEEPAAIGEGPTVEQSLMEADLMFAKSR